MVYNLVPIALATTEHSKPLLDPDPLIYAKAERFKNTRSSQRFRSVGFFFQVSGGKQFKSSLVVFSLKRNISTAGKGTENLIKGRAFYFRYFKKSSAQ